MRHTLRYGPLPDQVADLTAPPGAGPHPLVVVIHGGFWQAEWDRAHTGKQCAGLTSAGYAACAIEYRRVGQPGGGWPGTFDDVAAAVAAVPRLAGGLVDTARVALMGHSAGAHLALWAASCSPPPALRGVVALAGICDLTLAHRLRLGDGVVDALLGGSPGSQPERYAAADPARLVPLGVPAVLIHGDRDRLVPLELSHSYVAAARAAGDDVELITLPGVGHMAVIEPRSAAWPHVLAAAARILASPAPASRA